MRIDAEQLAAILRDAERDHAQYERHDLHGRRDPNWADWYAVYIVARLGGTATGPVYPQKLDY